MLKTNQQTFVGLGVFGLGAVIAFGAIDIPSEAGYAGVGPNFLPIVVAGVLLVCGAWVIWEARSGGFRHMEQLDAVVNETTKAEWQGFAWLSAGLLANAVLVTTIGFILSCTLCFVLAARGLRLAQIDAASRSTSSFNAALLAKDISIGAAIASPVYWMFTKLLSINLPGITSTGWI